MTWRACRSVCLAISAKTGVRCCCVADSGSATRRSVTLAGRPARSRFLRAGYLYGLGYVRRVPVGASVISPSVTAIVCLTVRVASLCLILTVF